MRIDNAGGLIRKDMLVVTAARRCRRQKLLYRVTPPPPTERCGGAHDTTTHLSHIQSNNYLLEMKDTYLVTTLASSMSHAQHYHDSQAPKQRTLHIEFETSNILRAT